MAIKWFAGLLRTRNAYKLASDVFVQCARWLPGNAGLEAELYCSGPGVLAVLAALAPGKMRISCRLGVAAEQRHAGLWEITLDVEQPGPVRLNLLPEGSCAEMIRLEWKDCRLTAEGTQVVLENAALRTCWRLEPEGLALACVENRLTGFVGRVRTVRHWSGLHGPAGRGNWNGRPGRRRQACVLSIIRALHLEGRRAQCEPVFWLYPQTPFPHDMGRMGGSSGRGVCRCSADSSRRDRCRAGQHMRGGAQRPGCYGARAAATRSSAVAVHTPCGPNGCA